MQPIRCAGGMPGGAGIPAATHFAPLSRQARSGPLGTLDLSGTSAARLDAALSLGAAAARMVAEGTAPPDLVVLRETAVSVRALRSALLCGAPEDARRVAEPLAEAYRRGGEALHEEGSPVPALAPEGAAEVACVDAALRLLAARREAVATLQVGDDGRVERIS